jgi:ActR/RegA family two-component response regulator
MEGASKRVLLIVDDIPEVARALRRFLRKDFDAVHVAHTVEEAEGYLGAPESPPTHLVCDQYLGKGKALGADLIPVWRERYSHLRVAVLFTGSEVDRLVVRPGIDKIFGKPIDVRELLRFLLQGEATSAAIAR